MTARAAQQPLELEHPDAAEQRFDRELGRIEEPQLGDDPVVIARRQALAACIERAHRAWAAKGKP